MRFIQSHAEKVLQTLLVAHLAGIAIAGVAWGDDLQAILDKANQHANQSRYSQAIPLYEQAVERLPQEQVLKKNLAVLYVNYAYTLQDQKDYPGSIVQFDKALALYSDNREAKIGKAGTFYYQAMDLRDGNPADYAARRALLEKAIALNPEETAFKKAIGSAYLDEAYQLATQEQFKPAADLLEKGMAYDPQNASIRQSLANVYLGMARDDAANRKMWADKALSVDNSPRITQNYDQLMAAADKPMPPAQAGAGGFANAPDEARNAAPKEISQLSVAEMISAVEKQLSIEPGKDATLMERLEAAEKQVLGKPQKGPLAVRTKEVYTTLLGSYDATSHQQSNVNLVQSPVEVSENSYLDEVFRMTDGKVIRWGKFPVRIYIEDPGQENEEKKPEKTETNPEDAAKTAVDALYRPEYKAAVLEGLNAWKTRTNGWVNFVEVKNPDAADIVVKWDEAYVDRFADPETVPDFYKTYTPPKRTALMRAVQLASMFTPGYYSLAPQAVNAMMQYQQYKKMEVLREESELKLGLAPTRDLSPDAAKILMRNMAAREFGHALGIKANSPKPGDLLYPELKSDAPQFPSPRDLETLRQLYNRPPNIILNAK